MTIKRIDGCIGCETCMKTCPTDLIRMDPATGKAKFYVFQAKARPWTYRPRGDRPPPSGGGGGGGGKRPAPPEDPGDGATGSRTAMGVSSLLIALEGLLCPHVLEEDRSCTGDYSTQIESSTEKSLQDDCKEG